MSKNWLVASIVFLAGFLILSVLVKKQLLSQFDFDSTVRVQNKIPQRVDPLLSALSLVGSFEVMSLVLLIWLLTSRPRLLKVPVLAIYVLGMAIELAGKIYLSHSGPPFMFLRYDFDFIFPSSYVQTGNSFPSGHAYRAVFLAVLFIYRFHKKIIISLPILLLLMAMLISRVSLGEHWASDVLGGSLLGLSLASLSLSYLTSQIPH